VFKQKGLSFERKLAKRKVKKRRVAERFSGGWWFEPRYKLQTVGTEEGGYVTNEGLLMRTWNKKSILYDWTDHKELKTKQREEQIFKITGDGAPILEEGRDPISKVKGGKFVSPGKCKNVHAREASGKGEISSQWDGGQLGGRNQE